MADNVSGAKATAQAQGNEAVGAQQELNAQAMKLNMAMAWLQMMLAIIGKLAGR
jgi:hypothetical protein